MSAFHDPGRLMDRVRALHKAGGFPRGDFPGWPGVNRLYTVLPAQWTVVTGTPQSGKSEFLDAMMVNLAESSGWSFALYSPENHPIEAHIAKLAEKRARKPFGDGPTRPMNARECDDAAGWVLEHFRFIDPPGGDCTPENLIATAMAYRPGGGKWGVALDPWNTLDHIRPDGMNETDYISFILTHVTRMVREAGIHCWLVVHPAKMYRLKDGTVPVPRPYDISGSAHWYNKADNILCIHREKVEDNDLVEIHVQKVRFKHVGHIGLAELRWDKVTGRYFEAPNNIVDITTGRPERYADPEAIAERAAIQMEVS